jgi:hypothetical protein
MSRGKNREENMRQELVRDPCWVHVFEGPLFQGRGRLLNLGESITIAKVRSIIVGPAAMSYNQKLWTVTRQ